MNYKNHPDLINIKQSRNLWHQGDAIQFNFIVGHNVKGILQWVVWVVHPFRIIFQQQSPHTLHSPPKLVRHFYTFTFTIFSCIIQKKIHLRVYSATRVLISVYEKLLFSQNNNSSKINFYGNENSFELISFTTACCSQTSKLLIHLTGNLHSFHEIYF